MRTYTRTNCAGKCNRPPDAAINPRAWAKGARRRAPARRPVPSRAWPVRPLRLPGTTWRLHEARGIASRFDGLLGSRHGRDAAIRFPRKPAHSGCCQTRRSQNPKTVDLHSFGDYCRGDEPRAGNGTRILFKSSRARITPQISTRLAGVHPPDNSPRSCEGPSSSDEWAFAVSPLSKAESANAGSGNTHCVSVFSEARSRHPGRGGN